MRDYADEASRYSRHAWALRRRWRLKESDFDLSRRDNYFIRYVAPYPATRARALLTYTPLRPIWRRAFISLMRIVIGLRVGRLSCRYRLPLMMSF